MADNETNQLDNETYELADNTLVGKVTTLLMHYTMAHLRIRFILIAELVKSRSTENSPFDSVANEALNVTNFIMSTNDDILFGARTREDIQVLYSNLITEKESSSMTHVLEFLQKMQQQVLSRVDDRGELIDMLATSATLVPDHPENSTLTDEEIKKLPTRQDWIEVFQANSWLVIMYLYLLSDINPVFDFQLELNRQVKNPNPETKKKGKPNEAVN